MILQWRNEDSEAAGRFLSVMDLCYIAVFAAVTAVLAQISIPLPGGVPMTLQTLAVPLGAVVLGRKRGCLAALLYVAMGAVGVPVFAGFKGGIGSVVGITGGFIFSFPVMAYVSGIWAKKGIKNPLFWFGLFLGVLINYFVGTVWFMFMTGSGLQASLAACVIPFIPTTLLKMILTGLLGTVLENALERAELI